MRSCFVFLFWICGRMSLLHARSVDLSLLVPWDFIDDTPSLGSRREHRREFNDARKCISCPPQQRLTDHVPFQWQDRSLHSHVSVPRTISPSSCWSVHMRDNFCLYNSAHYSLSLRRGPGTMSPLYSKFFQMLASLCPWEQGNCLWRCQWSNTGNDIVHITKRSRYVLNSLQHTALLRLHWLHNLIIITG